MTTRTVDYNALWAAKMTTLSPEHEVFVDAKIREAIDQGKRDIVFAGAEASISALEHWATQHGLRTRPGRNFGRCWLPGDDKLFDDDGGWSTCLEWGPLPQSTWIQPLKCDS